MQYYAVGESYSGLQMYFHRGQISTTGSQEVKAVFIFGTLKKAKALIDL